MKIFMQTPIEKIEIKNHTISHIDYFNFLDKKTTISDKLRLGLSGSSLFGRLRNPEYINKLYLSDDPGYIKYLNEFKERYHDYDVIVMNPGVDLVHPEFLYKNFPDSIKCLHFIDDPHTTYSYGLPFSWVFDCATYISPSYNVNFTMKEILKLAGFKKTKWMPHCVTNINKPKYGIKELEKQLITRNNKAIYVGSYYSGKNQRLIHLKKELKNNLDIYGRYPLKGFFLPFSSFALGKPLLSRVKSISNNQRDDYYNKYSIGINMHLSSPSLETGNARLYELAYHGLAQVVDTSSSSLVENIFEPEKEILTYTNINECVEQVKRLQKDKDLRYKIALNSYNRALKEYNYKDRLIDLFEWFKSIQKNK